MTLSSAGYSGSDITISEVFRQPIKKEKNIFDVYIVQNERMEILSLADRQMGIPFHINNETLITGRGQFKQIKSILRLSASFNLVTVTDELI